MDREEVALVLDHLANTYDRALSEQTLEAWYEALKDCQVIPALAAANALITSQERWPNPATFLHAYAPIAQRMGGDTEQPKGAGYPSADCTFCHGSEWGEVEPLYRDGRKYEQWQPCRSCNPKGYTEWRDRWKPEAEARSRQRRASSPADLLPADPKAGVSMAREALRRVRDKGGGLKNLDDEIGLVDNPLTAEELEF